MKLFAADENEAVIRQRRNGAAGLPVSAASLNLSSDEPWDWTSLLSLVGKRHLFLIDIAPSPALRRIISFDDRVSDLLEMRPGVPKGRIVAAADVTASSAQS